MGHGSISEYSVLLYQINVENSQEVFRESLPTYPPFLKNPVLVTAAGMSSPRMASPRMESWRREVAEPGGHSQVCCPKQLCSFCRHNGWSPDWPHFVSISQSEHAYNCSSKNSQASQGVVTAVVSGIDLGCQRLSRADGGPRNLGHAPSRLESKGPEMTCIFLGPWKKVKVLVTQSCPTLCNPKDCARLLCPWESPGQNTGVGWHSLL